MAWYGFNHCGFRQWLVIWQRQAVIWANAPWMVTKWTSMTVMLMALQMFPFATKYCLRVTVICPGSNDLNVFRWSSNTPEFTNSGTQCLCANVWHDDVIKWKHFPCYWPFVRVIHRSPVNSPHKGQWRGALMFSLIFDWINSWVNNGEAGDLRRHRAHYDVIIMEQFITRKTVASILIGDAVDP